MRPDSGSGSVRKNHQTGVILNASVLKDLARTAALPCLCTSAARQILQKSG
jgi:hypothetical protein